MSAHYLSDRQWTGIILHADPVECLKWPTYGFSQEYTKLKVTQEILIWNQNKWMCLSRVLPWSISVIKTFQLKT